jgi:acetyl-CoA carboxylase/biotin carboxylase 1
MVLALKELSIRGDISTTVDYISKLIELDDFINNNIDTGWLDALIKENVDGIAVAEGAGSARRSRVKEKALNDDTYIVLGAAVVAFDRCSSGEATFLRLLEKGQLPPHSLLDMTQDVELILNGVKYQLRCVRNGPHVFSIGVAGDTSKFVVLNVRVLSDGGYLIDIGGKSHVAYLTNKGDSTTGMRINVGGANIVFSPDYDPSSLRTDVAGKLVKKLVSDGSQVKKGEAYCEIEVMKMFMPLKVEEAGEITWQANEGAAIAPGDVLATLELDNPDNVSQVTLFEGDLNVSGWGTTPAASGGRPHLLLRNAIEKLEGGMAGYVLNENDIDFALDDLQSAVTNPMLPVYEIDEQLSVLSGRIPAKLFDEISTTISDFKTRCDDSAGSGVQLR